MPEDNIGVSDEVEVTVEPKNSEIFSPKDLTEPESDDTLSSESAPKKKSSSRARKPKSQTVAICQCALAEYNGWQNGEVRHVSEAEAEELLAVRRFNRPVFQKAE